MRVFLLVLMVCFSFFVSADVLTLKPGHPQTYIVKKGDTLWDISALFLDDPWRWPTLWGANPQIPNPHLIYPGDRLNLVYLDGQPRLVRKGVVKMSPKMRPQSRDSIPTLPLSSIEPYLSYQKVIGAKDLPDTPEVIGGERDAVRYTLGDIIFINDQLPLGKNFGLYALGREFHDAQTGVFLGLEAILTATGQVVAEGATSKISVLSIRQEIKPGQRVLALDEDAKLPAYFMPHPAPEYIGARIIATDSLVREIGPMDVAIIDRGEKDGTMAGQVFAVYQEGTSVIKDKNKGYSLVGEGNVYNKVMSRIADGRTIEQPDVYRGEVILFKTYDNVSLGLVINGQRPMQLKDTLERPEPMVFAQDAN